MEDSRRRRLSRETQENQLTGREREELESLRAEIHRLEERNRRDSNHTTRGGDEHHRQDTPTSRSKENNIKENTAKDKRGRLAKYGALGLAGAVGFGIGVLYTSIYKNNRTNVPRNNRDNSTSRRGEVRDMAMVENSRPDDRMSYTRQRNSHLNGYWLDNGDDYYSRH